MRRATVYRAQGRTRQAVKDYGTVLTLKADFAQVGGGVKASNDER